ncbi:uncharacterized protein LOC104885189 [Beta vulgaris subsp. vulgaris]|uniref:uncharacterized protein LOC104885189 n=1 Tax=Beta vulgaris subsp. vulgaris TaxID=3555 RepID=UPI00053F9A34|nr:uncharacterized protein LOC104885189 [Beta vulgaris subsp. vulgaris]
MVTEQMIYGVVVHKSSGVRFCLSLVYGHNDKDKRSALWNDLSKCSSDVRDIPWVVMGDFNNVLNMNETIGQPILFNEIENFKKCVENCGLADAKMTGPLYTWSNKQHESDYMATKIERVLINDQWELSFPATEATFLPEGSYDHCPCIVKIHPDLNKRIKPFRFYNMWCDAERFLRVVEEVWNEVIAGTRMFQVVTKMKKLKKPLKALNRQCFSNIENQTDDAKSHLDSMQLKLKRGEVSTAE